MLWGSEKREEGRGGREGNMRKLAASSEFEMTAVMH